MYFNDSSFRIFTILKYSNVQQAYPQLSIPKIFIPGTVVGIEITLGNKNS